MQQYRHSPRKEIFMFEIRQVPAIEALEKIKEGMLYISVRTLLIYLTIRISGEN